MDVGAPSNWERIAALFDGDWNALRSALRWGSLDDVSTRAVNPRARRRAAISAIPTAPWRYAVLRDHLQPGETGIFLATAHPAKFKEALEPVLGREIRLPPALQEVAGRPLLAEAIPADLGVLRERLSGLLG